MSLKSLIEKTLEHEVARENGISEEVAYHHSISRTKEENLKCIPQEITYGEESRDKLNDFVVFHALTLLEEPSHGDTIVWNGIRYNYEKTVSRLVSTYDVKASIKRHTGGRAR